ncbi:hypothetical protein PM082_015199 [Marasmius tenuissimus]|nr:hypothetical protein PM082_015199 [Marasmius tenuissimus]
MWRPQSTPSNAKKIKLPKPLKQKPVKAPEEKFIVVVNPWMSIKNTDFLIAMGGWLQCAFGKAALAIYHMGDKRSFIIVEFPANTDIKSRLGAHHPCEIFKEDAQFEHLRRIPKPSLIYEYNFPIHKHPNVTGGFLAEYPSFSDPTVPDSPFKWGPDYPPPRTAPARPPPVECQLALPIPKEKLDSLQPLPSRVGQPQRPIPSNPPPFSGPSATPLARPQRIQDNHHNTSVDARSRTPPDSLCTPTAGKVGKLDPYEEDEQANALLHSATPALDSPPPESMQSESINVKKEDEAHLELHSRRGTSHPQIEREGTHDAVSAGLRDTYERYTSATSSTIRKSEVSHSPRDGRDRRIKAESFPDDVFRRRSGFSEVKVERGTGERHVDRSQRGKVEVQDNPSIPPSGSRAAPQRVKKEDEDEDRWHSGVSPRSKAESRGQGCHSREERRRHHPTSINRERSPRGRPLVIKKEEDVEDRRWSTQRSGAPDASPSPMWRPKRERSVDVALGDGFSRGSSPKRPRIKAEHDNRRSSLYDAGYDGHGSRSPTRPRGRDYDDRNSGRARPHARSERPGEGSRWKGVKQESAF